MEQQKFQQQMVVNKQRQNQSDLIIQKQYKEARSFFFTHTVEEKLCHENIQLEYRQQILGIFLKGNQDDGELKISLADLGKLEKYRKQIQQLKQQYQRIVKSFILKQKECISFIRVMQLKLNTLKVIQIAYQSNVNIQREQKCYYSINAFTFFKFIHQNSQLTEVTLKEVQVQQFQKLLLLMNPQTRINQKQGYQETWIINFTPLKALKLAIKAKLTFDMELSQQNIDKINGLQKFVDLFASLSDITAKILASFRSMFQSEKMWHNLWKCLKTIRAISIELQQKFTYFGLNRNETYFIRSTLFGGLALFTEIDSLSFKNIRFSRQVAFRDFLGLEENLNIIFENNQINHLKMIYCHNFPLIPKRKNLKSIELILVSLRKQYDFVTQLNRNNPFLKSIKCQEFFQKWEIEESLFDKLHYLIIQGISSKPRIVLNDLSKQSFSQIKYLFIQSAKFKGFSIILPKLLRLTYLQLRNIDIGHELIQQLHLRSNKIITDKGIQEIDLRWPNLQSVSLRQCCRLTESLWGICKFIGLMEVSTNLDLIKTGKHLQMLRKRGVKVQIQ